MNTCMGHKGLKGPLLEGFSKPFTTSRAKT